MFSSVVYTPANSRVAETSSFSPSKSPIFQIIIAKAVTIFLIFFLGDLLPQFLATIIISISSGLEFWVTKNMGRVYLQAAWSVDCSGEEDVWVYEANFKSPSQYEEIFWYSQIIYGILLVIAVIIVAAAGKFSLAVAGLIAFGCNYMNFSAFSKIITLRNSGVLDQIANDAGAKGEERETIRIPMMHRSKIGSELRNSRDYVVRSSKMGPPQ
jgi:hypothetical protein